MKKISYEQERDNDIKQQLVTFINTFSNNTDEEFSSNLERYMNGTLFGRCGPGMNKKDFIGYLNTIKSNLLKSINNLTYGEFIPSYVSIVDKMSLELNKN